MDIDNKKEMVTEIEVPIAGRIYPLSIPNNLKDEVYTFSNRVNKAISEFEKMYELHDKQDALALAVLELFSKMPLSSRENEEEKSKNHDYLSSRLSAIEQQLLSIVNDT